MYVPAQSAFMIYFRIRWHISHIVHSCSLPVLSFASPLQILACNWRCLTMNQTIPYMATRLADMALATPIHGPGLQLSPCAWYLWISSKWVCIMYLQCKPLVTKFKRDVPGCQPVVGWGWGWAVEGFTGHLRYGSGKRMVTGTRAWYVTA